MIRTRALSVRFAPVYFGIALLLAGLYWNASNAPIPVWDAGAVDKTLPELLSAPGANHWMGTDDRGRDVFSRWLGALAISTAFAAAAITGSLVLAFLLGALSVLSDLSTAVSRILAGVCRSLPLFFFAAALAETGLTSFLSLLLLRYATSWIALARQWETAVEEWKAKPYTEAAIAQGVAPLRLMTHHLIPHTAPVILSWLPRMVIEATLSLALLDYLGLGLPAPTPTLGELLRQFREHPQAYWILFPALLGFSGLWYAAHLLCEGLKKRLLPAHLFGSGEDLTRKDDGLARL